MAFIQEVEKQNELQIQIQSLSQTYRIPARDLQIKLSQEMDLHIEVCFIFIQERQEYLSEAGAAWRWKKGDSDGGEML